MLEVLVKCVFREPISSRYVMMLESCDGDYYIPINIGAYEAEAIYTELNNIPSPRPLPYDFIKSIISILGDVEVSKVIIDEKDGHIYKAKLELCHNGSCCIIDCRPSDAVALGLRLNSPIYVNDELAQNKKSLNKNCLNDKERMLLEHIITDQASTYWTV